MVYGNAADHAPGNIGPLENSDKPRDIVGSA